MHPAIRFVPALVLLSTPIAHAEQPPAAWMSHYGGPAIRNDWSRELALGPDGSVTVIGESQDHLGRGDFVTVRYDADGNELWANRFNGVSNGFDRPIGVAVDALGNTFTVGHTWQPDNSNQDYAVIRYNPDGTTAWIYQYNGPGNRDDQVWDVVADGSGGAFVGGSVFVTPGEPRPASARSFHIAHYGATGNIEWEINYDRSPHNGAGLDELVMTPEGDLIALGWVYFDEFAEHEMLMMKVTPDGDIVWTRQFDPGGDVFDNMVLRIGNAGDIYASFSYMTYDSANNLDGRVVKYTPDGSFEWAAGIDLVGPDGFIGIVDDEDGNVYVSGGWNNAHEFSDATVASFSSSGDLRWLRVLDGPNTFDFQESVSLLRGHDGTLYVGLDWQYPDASYKYTIMLMDTDGIEIERWQYTSGFGSSDSYFNGGGWAMDAQGNLYFTGYSGIAPGNSDITTVKIPTRTTTSTTDLDGNGAIDIADLLTFLSRFFLQDPAAERTGDAPPSIDVADLLAYLQCWFAGDLACP